MKNDPQLKDPDGWWVLIWGIIIMLVIIVVCFAALMWFLS